MPATINFHLTGGAANSDPNLSLGGASSSVQLSATAMNNLFDDVPPAEAAAGDTEYRAIDLTNAGDALATVVKAFMDPDSTSAATRIDLGVEASPIGSTTSIANESAAPADVTFAHYTSASKLTVPDIPAGGYARLWVRRVVDAAAGNINNDTGTFKIEYA